MLLDEVGHHGGEDAPGDDEVSAGSEGVRQLQPALGCGGEEGEGDDVGVGGIVGVCQAIVAELDLDIVGGDGGDHGDAEGGGSEVLIHRHVVEELGIGLGVALEAGVHK